ncbi:MAG: M1 family metallopeptidase [Segetibacter sp.]
MLKNTLIIVCLAFSIISNGQFKFSQGDDRWKKIYRSTPEKDNDLIHTKLNVKFDYAKSYLYGKAWITLKPHFYNTDSLRLDAKGMDIKKVSIWKNGKATNLSYSYTDSLNLRITLDRVYKGGEPYTVFIDYTSKPNEFKAEGSAAITDAKGLYFINPKGEEKNKPTQIWTQGETEASSVWFPTIDRPNQKTTQEIAMTVPAKYVTLSNGILINHKKNADGTRTDYWKMDLPHSPYLFFMGVGDFAIVKDSYKGKEVSYFVEKPFEKVARKIFGLTPEMMAFYSLKLNFEFPWPKYSQIVGRDYVSGAMENTTATLHSEYLQQNARQLTDGNKYEDYVSHELFHQWFGDLVTAESWSNLTVNESFADYSETLWNEYKHGKDAGDEHIYEDMLTYFSNGSPTKDLVRFYYRDKEDMFDAISYHKGGHILNMLRNYVGDDAFFNSLNLYLNTYKFKTAEAQNLRLAFEEVTGKDLNWFWNQWYYGSGHPLLNITYRYDSMANKATVIVNQTQTTDKVFKLPAAIDIYIAGKKTRYTVWVRNKADTFSFGVRAKPDLINFDGDKVLLAEKTENKNINDYVYQYTYAKTYVDRREAIEYAIKNKDEAEARNFLITALDDPFYELRERVLKNLSASGLDANTIKKIENIARTDVKRINRAAAIDVLAQTNNRAYQDFFVAGTKDSSYSVAGSSLLALAAINQQKALSLLGELKKDAKGTLEKAVEQLEVLLKGDADFDEMTKQFDETSMFNKITEYKSYLTFLGNVFSTENFKKGVDRIIKFRDVVAGFNPKYKTAINNQLLQLKNRKQLIRTKENSRAIDEQAKYIDVKMKS